jgi:hypothetical protein
MSRLGDSHQSISPALNAAWAENPSSVKKFDAFEVRHLGAGGEARRAAAPWPVLLETRECSFGAADMLLAQEAERAAADHLLDRLVRRRRRQAFRHDRRYGATGAGQRHRQMREGPLQSELNGAIVGRRQFVGRRHQGAGERNAYCKAADACHNIFRQYRLVVVETQPVTQA